MSGYKVLVDADACPRGVMNILKKLKDNLNFELITIASFNHVYDGESHITVSNEPQAVDLALINKTQPGDIVVTQDWGLAAMVLGKRAYAIAPGGRIYHQETITFMLEERHLKAKIRREGGRTHGLPPRKKEDDQRFEKAFLKLLEIRNKAQDN